MKKINQVLLGILLLGASVFATTAQAGHARVMVVMKSSDSFTQVQKSYQKFGNQNLKSMSQNWGFAPNALSNVDGKIESTLNNLNSIVLTVSDESEIQKLKMNPDVEFVDREIFTPAPKPVVGFVNFSTFKSGKRNVDSPAQSDFKQTASTPWGILAVNAIQAWPTAHQGDGARVLVLDTGIDKDHPSLKDNFEKGKSFVETKGLPYEFFDDVGHGTHCSGTIAGVADATGFTGVAPKAKLLMGKVCANEGCSNLAVAQGINWGITEKVDVISMSLGGAQATPAERKAIAAAIKAGITIVAASGNSGVEQPGVVSFPAALPGVIAVGAVDAALKRANFSQWGPELSVVAPGVDVVSSVPQGTGREGNVQLMIGGTKAISVPNSFLEGTQSPLEPKTGELVFAGIGKPEDFAKINADGKIVLISRGDIPFREKVKNALAAKAAGIVFYNNVPGLIRGSLKNDDGSDVPVPVFMIEQTTGENAKAALVSGKQVQAQLQVMKSNYSSFDGTSMATPHTAGVVALMKATNKSLTPNQVKSILKETALVMSEHSNNETGAGMIQANLAVEKSVKLTSKLK